MGERPRRSPAEDVGWDELLSRDSSALARDAGAESSPGSNVIRLRVMDRECLVDLSAREILWAEGPGADVSSHLRILILHYLAGSGNAHVAARLATFRDFPGGDLYYSAFRSRAIDEVLQAFGAAPEPLRRAGERLRAEPVTTGSVGFRVRFFPKLPIVVALWLGDEEVPSSANLLFDASAGDILPTEDLAVAAEILVRRLKELSGA